MDVGNDQLWKELFWAFFEPFMNLFYPHAASRLDFSTVELIEGEVFTDLGEGSRREPDLVVQVKTTDGAFEIVLVHIEIQSERRAEMPYRMWEYYSLLRLRKRMPVFPVVVYLAPGSEALTKGTYTEQLFNEQVLTFTYNVIGLPDLAADEYSDREDPFAVALSAMMRSPTGDRVRRKLQALDRLRASGLDDARTHLLAYVVDKYLTLNDEESKLMSQLLKEPEAAERYQKWMTSWEEAAWNRGIEQGIEQGIEKGIERGIEQGIERGIERGIEKGIEKGIEEGGLRAKHDVIVRLIRSRFPETTPEIFAKIDAINDSARLDSIIDDLLTANSVSDLGLG